MLGLPTWSQGYAAKIMSLVRFSGVYKTRNSKLWKAEIEARSISIVSIGQTLKLVLTFRNK